MTQHFIKLNNDSYDNFYVFISEFNNIIEENDLLENYLSKLSQYMYTHEDIKGSNILIFLCINHDTKTTTNHILCNDYELAKSNKHIINDLNLTNNIVQDFIQKNINNNEVEILSMSNDNILVLYENVPIEQYLDCILPKVDDTQ